MNGRITNKCTQKNRVQKLLMTTVVAIIVCMSTIESKASEMTSVVVHEDDGLTTKEVNKRFDVLNKLFGGNIFTKDEMMKFTSNKLEDEECSDTDNQLLKDETLEVNDDVDKTMYTNTYVYVRTTPNILEDNIANIYAPNVLVHVIGTIGKWSKIEILEETYYIFSSLLSDEMVYIEPEENVVHIVDESQSVEQDVITYRYIPTSQNELEIFYRIVEAEVTGDDWGSRMTADQLFMCKVRIAQTILNRVECPNFPNTIEEVVYAKNQFTPLYDGRYYEVVITQMTRDACNYALLESSPDAVNGAVFFCAGKDLSFGQYLFTDEAGVNYFSSKYCTNCNH